MAARRKRKAKVARKRKVQVARTPADVVKYKKRFLARLEQGNAPGVAAKLAYVSHSAVYGWKQDDQQFAADWEAAIQIGVDKVETALVKRAIKSSDQAAIAYLKAYRPERYARKDGADQHGNVILNITLQEHYKQLERLGLPIPLIESDREEDDAPDPAETNNP